MTRVSMEFGPTENARDIILVQDYTLVIARIRNLLRRVRMVLFPILLDELGVASSQVFLELC